MYRKITLALGAALLLASCKRDNTTQPATPGSTLLSGFEIIDSTNNGVTTVTATGTITYDAQNRPVSLKRSDIISGTMAPLYEIRYFYNSPGDSLASRIEEIRGNEIVSYALTFANGLVVRDSAYSNNPSSGRSAGNVTYSGNEVWRYSRSYGPAPQLNEVLRDTMHFIQTWQGADLVRQVDTIKTVDLTSTDISYERAEFITSYRAEDNPFYVLTRPLGQRTLVGYDPFVEQWNSAPRHLIAQRVWQVKVWGTNSSPQQQAFTFGYQYSFGANGRLERIAETPLVNQHMRVIRLKYY